jgi:hypothetical protein
VPLQFGMVCFAPPVQTLCLFRHGYPSLENSRVSRIAGVLQTTMRAGEYGTRGSQTWLMFFARRSATAEARGCVSMTKI